MMFSRDDVEKAGAPPSAGIEDAAALYVTLDKRLESARDVLLELQTADDDAVLMTERAQIGTMMRSVAAMGRLVREVGNVMINQEIEVIEPLDNDTCLL